jgi:hypothetical protein
MSARDNIEAAFSPQGARDIAAVICYEGIYIRDHWAQFDAGPWWMQESPGIAEQLAWRRRVIQKTGQDWYVLPLCRPRQERERLELATQGDQAFLVDRQAGTSVPLRRPTIGGWTAGVDEVQSVVPGRLAETPDEIDRLIPAAPAFDSAGFLQSGRGDLAEALRREHPNLYPIRHVSSPLWNCYSLWGFEGMMSKIAERPDLVEYACRRYLAQSLWGGHQAAALGAAGIWIEECFTDMVSPAAFRKLNSPFLRTIVEEIRAYGMRSIYYYCGNPAGKWDLLFDAGADALSLEEGKKGFAIDINDVADRARGRCAILGNLDAINLLPNASEAELRAEIARQIAVGRRNGSRFVMSIGSPVTPGTSVARVRLYCDLAHELGAA